MEGGVGCELGRSDITGGQCLVVCFIFVGGRDWMEL